MNPFLQEIVLSLLRKAVTGVAAVLVTNGWLNEGQTEQLIVGAAGLVASIVWSIYQRYKDQLEKLAGLQLPAGRTLEDAKALAKTGAVAPATTPTDTAPPSVSGEEARRLVGMLLLIATLGVSACAGRTAPVLIGETGIAASGFIHEASKIAVSLETPGPISKERSLEIQQALGRANMKLRDLPPILRALDAAQKANNPTAPLIEQALDIIAVVSKDLDLSVQGIPVLEVTTQFAALVNQARGAVATVRATVEAIRNRPQTLRSDPVEHWWNNTPVEAPRGYVPVVQ
jgi:hypothetical protein